MAEKPITNRQLDLLRAIARYVSSREPRRLPDVQWLADALHVSTQAICNYKRELKIKGYLDPTVQDALLTSKAWQLLENLQIVIPTQVPILGEVMAGDARRGDLVENVVNILSVGGTEYIADSEFPTIIVPNVKEKALTFALRVVGESMEYEHIFDRDYVIVQRFVDGEGPRHGDLIVTYYLPSSDEHFVDSEQILQWSIPEDYLAGPTIKYFYKEQDFYRLSWRKDTRESLYTIETRSIRPIGTVVGVYRDISS